jgi:hypothetical protein
LPSQIVCIAVDTDECSITGDTGIAYEFTVIFEVPPLISVYVIVALPALLAVISPVEEFILTEASLDTHGLVVAGVPLPVNCKLSPTHKSKFVTWPFGPVIVGAAYTVKVAVASQPVV